MEQMALQNGGPKQVENLISGRGTGLILKSLAIQYRVRLLVRYMGFVLQRLTMVLTM
jgi:hypothetical protein